MTTPNQTLPQPWNLPETLIQSYAEIALAGGDEALKDGWRSHLMHRFLELDKDFPGSQLMIIERIRQIK